MKKSMKKSVLLAIAMLLPASLVIGEEPQSLHEVMDPPRGYVWKPVSGTGVHRFSTAVIHSQENTATGMIQRSTDIVELEGDLDGRVLYHPVSVFDFASGTLINTGQQVFSGTVLGSEPVLIRDEEFRFEVNLATGQTVGEIYLEHRIAGPRIRCRLQVDGNGTMTPEGDAVVEYQGLCRMRSELPTEAP